MKSALKKVSLILAICFVAFHLYTAAFGTMPGIAQKSIHLGFLLVIFYINAMVDSEKRWEQIFLGIMALFALGGCAYITILDENLQLRAGIVYASDILFAILLIIAIFEACRRKMGNPLVIITLVFVAYAFLGKYIPGFLNQPGMTLKKFTSLVYLTTDGIFGSPLYASASYVVLFVLLGAIMSVSGIGDYMTNLATSLFGHMRGGPAKVAVVASGFFGSISGSPTANVIGTGTFTIPMMKKNGFEPEFAAAVEATASTGGAIMPPIMGSTAFIMAEMLGIPYTAVAKAALIPAILYFLAVLFGVDIYAAKHGLKGIPRSQLPKVRSMLKQIYMLAPLIFLIFCMAVFNMTIVRSGLLTIIVTLVLVEINPKTRMTKEQWLQIPVQTVKSAVSVGIACAMAGIISGVIMGSGLGYRISSILTSVAGTSMLLLLVLTMVVSLIMGMGVPTTAAYLVLASLVAPTMIQLGIPPLAAHMFIFYFGCISSITPPVALAAYAGAGLAGCDPNKTGYKAFRLAFCSFLMPYLFVYNPVLLMEGGVLDILWSLVTALIGAYLLASGFEGFFFRWSLKWFERPLMILGAVMLIVPGMTLSCYNAGGEFEGLPAEQIMHVATHSGTGATVHVITSAKSDINSIPDLAGTKFGVTAGMMAGYLDDVLWAYDMTTDDLGSVVNLSLSDLCTALQDGNIDAFLYATPAPGTNFTDLAMSFGIKVVDIGQEAVDKLMAEKPWYHTVVIPAGTYDGCDEDITTFAQYTALCARADVPEETVYNLVKTMMENADALEAVHKNAAGTCPERGIEGALIPMHPGAERYYKEVGVLD